MGVGQRPALITLKYLTWSATWSEDDFIWTDFVTDGASTTSVKCDALPYGIGDVDHVSGTDMTAGSLPAIGGNSGAAWSVKRTRTAVVR